MVSVLRVPNCGERMEETMRHRTYLLTVGVVFSLIALAHLLRLALGATVVVEGFAVPMWMSVLAALVMGFLAFEGFRLCSKPQPGS